MDGGSAGEVAVAGGEAEWEEEQNAATWQVGLFRVFLIESTGDYECE